MVMPDHLPTSAPSGKAALPDFGKSVNVPVAPLGSTVSVPTSMGQSLAATSASSVSLPMSARTLQPQAPTSQSVVLAVPDPNQLAHAASFRPQPMPFVPGREVTPGESLLNGPPPALTAGLPDPASIDAQKSQYMRSLDDQLKRGSQVLDEQLKQQQAYLQRMGEQQKRQYSLQVDQQIKVQELDLVQQHNQQLLMLQQAAQQQKAALEQQANALLLEYSQKKAAEDIASQMYKFEKDAFEAGVKYKREMEELQKQQHVAARHASLQGEALARQATMSNMQAIAAQQVAMEQSRSVASISAATHPHGRVTPTASYMPPAGPPTPTASYIPVAGTATPPVGPMPPPHSASFASRQLQTAVLAPVHMVPASIHSGHATPPVSL